MTDQAHETLIREFVASKAAQLFALRDHPVFAQSNDPAIEAQALEASSVLGSGRGQKCVFDSAMFEKLAEYSANYPVNPHSSHDLALRSLIQHTGFGPIRFGAPVTILVGFSREQGASGYYGVVGEVEDIVPTGSIDAQIIKEARTALALRTVLESIDSILVRNTANQKRISDGRPDVGAGTEEVLYQSADSFRDARNEIRTVTEDRLAETADQLSELHEKRKAARNATSLFQAIADDVLDAVPLERRTAAAFMERDKSGRTALFAAAGSAQSLANVPKGVLTDERLSLAQGPTSGPNADPECNVWVVLSGSGGFQHVPEESFTVASVQKVLLVGAMYGTLNDIPAAVWDRIEPKHLRVTDPAGSRRNLFDYARESHRGRLLDLPAAIWAKAPADMLLAKPLTVGLTDTLSVMERLKLIPGALSRAELRPLLARDLAREVAEHKAQVDRLFEIVCSGRCPDPGNGAWWDGVTVADLLAPREGECLAVRVARAGLLGQVPERLLTPELLGHREEGGAHNTILHMMPVGVHEQFPTRTLARIPIASLTTSSLLSKTNDAGMRTLDWLGTPDGREHLRLLPLPVTHQAVIAEKLGFSVIVEQGQAPGLRR